MSAVSVKSNEIQHKKPGFPSSGLHEFEAQKNHEVNEFRTKMRTFCEERAQERQRLPWQEWMKYNFPCDLEPSSTMSHSGKLRNIKKIFVNVRFEASEVRLLVVVLFCFVFMHTVFVFLEQATICL